MPTFTLLTSDPSHKAFLSVIEGLNILTFGDTPPAGQKIHVWCNNSPNDRLKATSEIRRLEALGFDVHQIDEVAVAVKAVLGFDQNTDLANPDDKGLAAWLLSMGVLINDPESVIKRQSKILAELEILPTMSRLKDWLEAIKNSPESGKSLLIKDAAQALGVSVSAIKKDLSSSNANADDTMLFEEIEPYHSPINPAELLAEMSETIRKFIVLDHHQADIVAAWCVATWFLDQVQIAPILLITAPEKGCGKTQLLSVAGKLVYRPLQSCGITPAAVYRVIGQYHPTLLIDEIDTVFNDKDSEPLRGVINAGHEGGGGKIVCDGDKNQPRRFKCFGFKALAGIKADQLKDTITDRSLVIRLERKTKSDHVTRLRHAPEGLFSTVQTKLARVKQDYTLPLKINLPDALGNRQQDNAEPLLQIAQIAGGEWVERLTNALLTLAGNTEPPKSAGVELLESIQVIFKQISGDRISTADLIKRLCADPEGRWVGYNPKSAGDGRNISAKQIANLLKPFEVRSTNMRDGYEVVKGYLVADFENAFQRYIATTPQNLPLHRYKPLQANIGAGFGVAGEEIDNATEKSAATLEANIGAGYRRVADVASENGGIEEVGIKIVNGKGMF